MNQHNQLRQKKAGLVGAMFGGYNEPGQSGQALYNTGTVETQESTHIVLGHFVRSFRRGLLISLPSTPVLAAPASQINPCPRIFYQEPYNSRVLVPQGCPPNARTQLLSAELTPNRIVPAEAPTTPAQVAPTPGMPGVAIYGATQSNPPGTATTLPITPPLPENRSQPIAMVMPMEGKVDVRLKNNTNALISYEAIGYTQRRFLPGGKEIVLRNLPTPVTVTLVRQDKGLLKVIPLSNSQPGMLQVSLDEAKHLSDNQGVLRIQKDGQVFLN